MVILEIKLFFIRICSTREQLELEHLSRLGDFFSLLIVHLMQDSRVTQDRRLLNEDIMNVSGGNKSRSRGRGRNRKVDPKLECSNQGSLFNSSLGRSCPHGTSFLSIVYEGNEEDSNLGTWHGGSSREGLK